MDSAEAITNAACNYLRKRKYTEADILKTGESDFSQSPIQLITQSLLNNDISQNTSILFSSETHDIVEIDDELNRLKLWIFGLKNEIKKEELRQMLFPLFFHLYLDALRDDGIVTDTFTKVFKRYQHFFLSFDLYKEILIELDDLRTIKDIEQFPFTKSFRSRKFKLRLSSSSLDSFIEYLAEQCEEPMIFLKVLKSWFTIEFISEIGPVSEDSDEEAGPSCLYTETEDEDEQIFSELFGDDNDGAYIDEIMSAINNDESDDDESDDDESDDDKSNNDKSDGDRFDNDKSGDDRFDNDKSDDDRFNNDKSEDDRFDNDKFDNDRFNNDKSEDDRFDNDKSDVDKFDHERCDDDKSENDGFDDDKYENHGFDDDKSENDGSDDDNKPGTNDEKLKLLIDNCKLDDLTEASAKKFLEYLDNDVGNVEDMLKIAESIILKPEINPVFMCKFYHSDGVCCGSFSTSMNTVVTGCMDSKICLWNINDENSIYEELTSKLPDEASSNNLENSEEPEMDSSVESSKHEINSPSVKSDENIEETSSNDGLVEHTLGFNEKMPRRQILNTDDILNINVNEHNIKDSVNNILQAADENNAIITTSCEDTYVEFSKPVNHVKLLNNSDQMELTSTDTKTLDNIVIDNATENISIDNMVLDNPIADNIKLDNVDNMELDNTVEFTKLVCKHDDNKMELDNEVNDNAKLVYNDEEKLNDQSDNDRANLKRKLEDVDEDVELNYEDDTNVMKRNENNEDDRETKYDDDDDDDDVDNDDDDDDDEIECEVSDKNHIDDSNVIILRGHQGPISAVKLIEKLGLLVSVSHDGTMRVWDLSTHTCRAIYVGHNEAVWCLDVCVLNTYVATGSRDKTALLWTFDTTYPLRVFAGHLDGVTCVKFHPNATYLATGSADHTVRLFTVADGNNVRLFIGHSCSVYCLAFTPDGSLLASGDSGKQVIVWDIASAQKYCVIRLGNNHISSLNWMINSNVIAITFITSFVKFYLIEEKVNESPKETLLVSVRNDGFRFIHSEVSQRNTLSCIVVIDDCSQL